MAVLGTAGHVDHGKTTLVHALTGVDTDRLPEEKRRGITIELGFAPMEVVDRDGRTRTVAIVDVPGHERFVGTMVAGAQGVDVALLVVAADAGVMPQTREHLLVLAGLGVETLLVAITRADLADAETRALCQIDVEEALSRTPWPKAPVLLVSARTGEGLEALRAAIATATSTVDVRARRDRPARLAIDRAFAPRGQGVVVTGTLVAGQIAVGDELALLPGDTRVRVRGLHQHGQAVPKVVATGRVAVALSGVDLADLHRGETLAKPGTMAIGRAFDAVLTRARGGRPFGRRARIAFHLGTEEATGRLVPIAPIDSDELRTTMAGGETWLVRAVFTRPTTFAAGDRVVVRADGPLASVGTTLGSLVVLRTHPGRLVGGRARYAARLRGLLDPSELARAELEIDQTGLLGLSSPELALRLPARHVTKELANKLAPAEVRSGSGLRWVGAEARARAEAALLAHVSRYHTTHPDDEGVPLAVALSGVPANAAPGLAEATLERAVAEGRLARDGDRIRAAGFTARARADDPKALAMAAAFAEAGLAPPTMTELARTLGLEIPRARALGLALAGASRLVHVQGDLWFDAAALEELRGRVVALLEQKGTMSTGEFKDLVGASRKYVVPLAEWLDARKVTLRVGDVRKLRGR
ncbi:MAG: selenocysteine-specific translation elongation factor [Myxococcales bacterium]|nr:selenocysteine-specific translation elongation factor [Myxococcales bacterium]